MKKKLISRCPICGEELAISRLTCGGCDTHVESRLPIPLFFKLPHDLQHFVFVFLRCRGSIREVEKELGISYPTVCKRLDLVNELLDNRPAGTGVGAEAARANRGKVLGQLERGEITAREAAALLTKGR